ADSAVGPVVAVVRVDDVDVHQRLLRDVAEEKYCGDGDHAGVAAEERERTDGVGARPGERAAVLERKRFGQNEETIHPIDEREASRDPERQARVNAAEQASDCRAEDKADTKRRIE